MERQLQLGGWGKELAKAYFPKYIDGIESRASRAIDEELLVLAGVNWDPQQEPPPMSRSYNEVECKQLSQKQLEQAIQRYDHTIARSAFDQRHPLERDLKAEITDLQTRLKKLETTRSPLPER